jgi:hypothetical protein
VSQACGFGADRNAIGEPYESTSCEDLPTQYFGTFDIDEATRTVIHHVQASLVPSYVGTDLKRMSSPELNSY